MEFRLNGFKMCWFVLIILDFLEQRTVQIKLGKLTELIKNNFKLQYTYYFVKLYSVNTNKLLLQRIYEFHL